jgi:hypothetical protein
MFVFHLVNGGHAPNTEYFEHFETGGEARWQGKGVVQHKPGLNGRKN